MIPCTYERESLGNSILSASLLSRPPHQVEIEWCPFVGCFTAPNKHRTNRNSEKKQKQKQNILSFLFTMSSNSIHLLSPVPAGTQTSTRHFNSLSSFRATPHPLLFSGVWLNGVKDKRVNSDSRCSAKSKPRTQEYTDVFHPNEVPMVIKWHEIVEEAIEEEARKVSISDEINKHVKAIKMMLGSMEDGEISPSAYDTAWVALVEDINGSGTPQFPTSLEWIANNQLPDGSWGDSDIFQAHDRLINTLGCVIALKSWNLHPDKCDKGMAYFRDNLCKLEDENPEHMPIGFEVAFPSLLEMARSLDIEVPDDSPVLQEIYAGRNLKLKRIPKDIMHKVPTTLLHSLEGMPGLEWEKLLKLQGQDGSFLFSPSSTAYALMQTKDHNCLAYLNRAVQKFNGGVPNVYPVDLFEHIWAVDRLERLGISRYFQPEIRSCIDYISRYWTKKGICWARNSEVHDIDDTAMGFRLLRLHGRNVSPDVFKCFEKNGGFVCFIGQSTQAVTGMFNLYRASQVLFPGERILENARDFSYKFLREKQDTNEVLDKWIITKDLCGEVRYALDIPWHASLPRVETRFYIEQYGGEDDVWIGKTLYRMPYVNNNVYLQLSKLDYNNCQSLHRIEWDNFQKWYEECQLGGFGISRRTFLHAYFVAMASIFEPERSQERLAWAKTTILLETIESYFEKVENNMEQRKAFVLEFRNGARVQDPVNGRRLDKMRTRQALVRMLVESLNHLSLDALMAGDRDISPSLRHAWEKWLVKWEEKGERRQGEAELLVETIIVTAGYPYLTRHSNYEPLANLTNKLCSELGQYQRRRKVSNNNGRHSTNSDGITTPEIECGMQQLVQLVYQSSSDELDHIIKKTFLTVAKSFYYSAYCDSGTINYHIARVLFERVY